MLEARVGLSDSEHRNLKSYEQIKGIPPVGSSIAEAQKALGYARPLPRKEHEPDRYCYRSNQTDDPTILILEAGPTGSWKRVTGLWLYEQPSALSPMQCIQSIKVSRDLAFGNGAKLGISLAEVKASLGAPQKLEKNTWIYIQERRIGKEKSAVDVMNWLEFRFTEGRATVIGTVKTVTN